MRRAELTYVVASTLKGAILCISPLLILYVISPQSISVYQVLVFTIMVLALSFFKGLAKLYGIGYLGVFLDTALLLLVLVFLYSFTNGYLSYTMRLGSYTMYIQVDTKIYYAISFIYIVLVAPLKIIEEHSQS